MEKRINFFDKGQKALKALYNMATYLESSSIERPLADLICFRVSQINGCAYCLDMHSKDLRAEGETEQRLYMLDAWRETSFYTDRERAALAWAEAITDLGNGRVSDDVYAQVTKHFSDLEIVDLTMAALTINCYNRINVAFRVEGGSYQAAQHRKQKAVAAEQ